MDCGQPETNWGGPTYGILLCVSCAGRHRSLGTHLTVIKSLTMDRWDQAQLKRMELGGNGQLQAWFAKCQTENSAVEMKYRTKAATLYRENLRAAAEEELSGGGHVRRDRRTGDSDVQNGRVFAAAEAAAAADLKREKAEAKAAAKRAKASKSSCRSREGPDASRDAASTARDGRASSASHVGNVYAGQVELDGANGFAEARSCGNGEYEVVFGPGGMGFTLMKDGVSRALVTRLAPGGTAFRLGVRTGDYLVGVDGRRLYDYDQLMLLLPYAARPLRLLFEGAGAALATPAEEGRRPGLQPPAAAAAAAAETRSARTGSMRHVVVSSSQSESDSDSLSDSSSGGSETSSGSSSSGREGDVGDGGRGNGARRGAGGNVGGQASEEGRRNGVRMDTRGKGGGGGGRRSSGSSGARVVIFDGNNDGGEENANDVGVVAASSKLSVTSRPEAEVVRHEGGSDDDASASGINVDPEQPPRDSAERAVLCDEAQDEQTKPAETVRGIAAAAAAANSQAKAAQPVVSTANGQGGKNHCRNGHTAAETGASGKKSNENSEPAYEARDAFEPRDREGEHVEPIDDQGDGEQTVVNIVAQSTVQTEEPSEGGVPRNHVDEGSFDNAVGIVAVAGAGVGADPASDTREGDGKDDVGESERQTGVGTDSKTEWTEVEEVDGRSANSKRDRSSAKGGKSSKRNNGGKKTEEGIYREKKGSSTTKSRSKGKDAEEREGSALKLREGTKASVRERKGSKWRKGLLRRKHKDGSWTVRYSGGMEERRVPPDRIRLRSAEDAVNASAGGMSNLTMAAAGGISSDGAGGGLTTKSERHQQRHSSQQEVFTNGKGGRWSGSAGGRAQAWATEDGAVYSGRHEDFRAPGELRDDFFNESHGDSDSEASALASFARVDPRTSDTKPHSSYAINTAFTLPVTAPPRRRMEGFGGGGIGGGTGGGSMPPGWAPASHAAAQRARELVVSFPNGSMGLTLTKEVTGGCSVTKILPGGVAETRGVRVGQRVCAVNGQPSGTYEQTMAVIAGSPRPINISFLVGGMEAFGSGGRAGTAGPEGSAAALGAQHHTWSEVGMAATVGLMDAANAVAVEWGIGSQTPGVFDEMDSTGIVAVPPPPQGFRVHQKHSLMAIPSGLAGGYGNSLMRHKTYAIDVPENMSTMTTKKALEDAPGLASGEFDVEFGEGELGMRLEERGSFKMHSVVSRVTKDGQAMSLGVAEGCTVVGINGEEYLSHAHTVATLKHSRRPTTVRFRAPERRSGR